MCISGRRSERPTFVLNVAPRFSNGAISHRPDVAELWADNMAMPFPFLAYLAVEQKSTSLTSTTVQQCGLQREMLKSSSSLSWQHIIGPQSQDTGLLVDEQRLGRLRHGARPLHAAEMERLGVG
ncbi:hypothetical protein CCMA1212_008990 [Trichoderma ghanense]|uniref:Uncharacterized protein n=1 Tax=Trichoderma ghanense TaxID=65468 RepID=A0ABY2GTI5_9HYPO